ncbi:hypothetical protein OAP76_07195 [Alphaproteobacteria bacterium]|nr:hypothetical protein [Alphaproteobacteria bacterium]
MFKSFWLYFYSIPFLFSLIILFTPTLDLFPLNPPKFSNALVYCSDVINEDIYVTEYGTMQDACIANFMGDPELIKPMMILCGLIGLLFVLPLSFYLILRFKKF